MKKSREKENKSEENIILERSSRKNVQFRHKSYA